MLELREAMTHRGPDGRGLWISPDKRIGLAHRRLAIIDPTTAAGQPMNSGDGRLHLVFNGMIYNHRELRKELIAYGVRHWRTDHSDTEVLLHAWERWGADCLPRLRGMFGFAVWDNKSRELWLARDRLGIKPLCFTLNDGELRFASEIGALLVGRPDLRQMNREALVNYLHYGYIPGEETPFRAIRRLLPGHLMNVRADGGYSIRRYWDVLDHLQPHSGRTERECAEECLSLLRQSITEHNLSDAPLGLLLSGGVDSSTVAALAVADAKRPLPSFTIAYANDFACCPDETGYAKTAAECAGTTYHQKTVSPEEFEAGIGTLIGAMAEPCSAYHPPLHAVAGMARKHGIRVLLGGEGADELFLGYNPYQQAFNKETGRMFSPFKSGLLRSIGRGIRVSQGAASRRLPDFTGTREGLSLRQLKDVLGPEMRPLLADNLTLQLTGKLFKRFCGGTTEPSVEQWLGYADIHMRLSSSLLPKLDVVTMRHGIECRLPFLDHRLVEWSLGLPGGLKMREQQGKIILKTAVRGILPSSVINRTKQGLSSPFEAWFSLGLGDRMRKEVRDFSARTGLLASRAVEDMIQTDARRSWYLYSFARWHRQFIEQDVAAV